MCLLFLQGLLNANLEGQVGAAGTNFMTPVGDTLWPPELLFLLLALAAPQAAGLLCTASSECCARHQNAVLFSTMCLLPTHSTGGEYLAGPGGVLPLGTVSQPGKGQFSPKLMEFSVQLGGKAGISDSSCACRTGAAAGRASQSRNKVTAVGT